ncbi:winged helix-turn-helix transcriptional regulator [Arthrobacter russicus]|jgi:DNA-binding HxlR family transcriptional regulator|uniref:DNA-binding HxlR family transcriptional regulator n=1 Tax=Arthrobacter russicus TaxID=172040 RepID=A0ABU1JBC8_9MICC|nr:helix-turn-helix domain-containing protein [Arthrobacter russicus]MDR6269727.1 DNA-binding HxlR family transcriptional regulator [Arthrobacter russicus]
METNIMDPNCPSRLVFQRIGDKWATLVIQVLEPGPMRFSDLRAKVAVVTPKVLTQTLRTLERDGLLTRTVFAQVPPRVDYQLTELGASLLPALKTLRTWAEQNVGRMAAAQDEYDAAIEDAVLSAAH